MVHAPILTDIALAILHTDCLRCRLCLASYLVDPIVESVSVSITFATYSGGFEVIDALKQFATCQLVNQVLVHTHYFPHSLVQHVVPTDFKYMIYSLDIL
jgi:hypothetical protein